MRKIWMLWAALSAVIATTSANAATQGGDAETTQPERHVILVTSDGLRWQEVFRGLDKDMLTTGNKVDKPKIVLDEFDAETTEARRAKLMPFLWDHVAKHGQIYGNRDKGSVAHVTNTMWFSYPGYNELLTGAPDDKRITSNKPIPNKNVTVFEWMAKKPEIDGKVAAFSSWGVHSAIFNSGRCGFPVDAGGREFNPSTGLTPGMSMLNDVRNHIPWRWHNEAFDAVVYPMFMEYLDSQKPRAAFMGFIETDAWGHEGDYPQYLTAAHRVDAWLKQLWEKVQSDPVYRDKTTIIFTCDHGRGDKYQKDSAWNSHGKTIEGSDAIFLAVWGPDTPATGEATSGEVTQSQVAATVAAAMGYDYNADHPNAGKPIEGAIKK